jgi:CRP-like cAMP-binding protein
MQDAARPDPRRNRLLAGLDRDEYDHVVGLLEPYDATLRASVYSPGRPIEHVYFPLDCVFSLVAGVGDDTVEVNTIGNEGMVGLPVFLGAAVSPNSAFCQVPGAALRMPAHALAHFLSTGDGTMHSLLHRYTQATIVQLAQSVACNQLHDARQRTARWLLMTRDRVGADSFPMTQEFLAQMRSPASQQGCSRKEGSPTPAGSCRSSTRRRCSRSPVSATGSSMTSTASCSTPTGRRRPLSRPVADQAGLGAARRARTRHEWTRATTGTAAVPAPRRSRPPPPRTCN